MDNKLKPSSHADKQNVIQLSSGEGGFLVEKLWKLKGTLVRGSLSRKNIIQILQLSDTQQIQQLLFYKPVVFSV
jgi:hypothetical protein